MTEQCPNCGTADASHWNVDLQEFTCKAPRENKNVAPYPSILHNLVRSVKYRPGWLFELSDVDRKQGSMGLTLTITTKTANTYDYEVCDACRSVKTSYRVNHYFPVPPATYNERSWRWWLFQRILEVEQHEAAEFFQIDNERAYAPVHAPGNDPYMFTEIASQHDAETNYRGERVQPRKFGYLVC